MRRALALAVVPVLALAACADGGDAGTDTTQAAGTGTTSGSTTGTATTNPPATSTAATSSGQTTDGDDGFDYVPWGPDDPPIPGHYAAMAASSGTGPQCDDVADRKPDAPFWTAVVGICRALAEGAPWPESTDVPAPPPPENDYIACVDAELAAMVDRALRWHADNPGRLPDVRYPTPSQRSPCQARIYDITVLGDEDLREGEGHPDGVALAVTGSSMSSVVDVSVDGARAELTGDFQVPDPGGGLTTVVVLAARSSRPRTAQVVVRTDTDTMTAAVDLPGEPSGDETAATDPSTATDPPGGTDAATATDATTVAEATGVPTAGTTP